MASSRRPAAAKAPGQGPHWPWRAGAVGLWLLAAVLAVAFLGFNPPSYVKSASFSPGANPLGPAGGFLAALAYDLCGLGVWWLVILPALAGIILWKERTTRPLFFLAGGGFWLVPASAALLGLSRASVSWGGGQLFLGGSAGAAMAQGLLATGGPLWAWGIPGALAAGGLALIVWSAWPVLGPFLEPKSQVDDETEPAKAPEPPAPQLEVQPQPEPWPAPESGPVVDLGPGPRIRPRTPEPAPAEPAAAAKPAPSRAAFKLPPLSLLQEPHGPRSQDQEENLRRNSRLLEEKLLDFGVQGQVVEVAPGPVVTMYEFKPAPGVKISKVAGLSDDLAMNLKARSIRIVAPIPGKAVIGIEIPNAVREAVFLREILAASPYQKSDSPLTVGLGKDILGAPVVTQLSDMPHLLIAGATGSGKSVFINTLVLSILYKATPNKVRLLMVDPKRIELSTYDDIPHLLYPIITSPKEATAGLRWAVGEMERRYELLAQLGVRNIESFNQRLEQEGWQAPPTWPNGTGAENDTPLEPLPYIVIIIDELADLMMVSSKEVENLITRLAQMARAAGIHLVLATQRPSVDVITGLIKANFTARISFQVTSRVDSRTILDQQGAEHLLGKGDLLFMPPGTAGLVRLHGAYVSDREIEGVADFLRGQARPEYDETIVQTGAEGEAGDEDFADEHYAEAVALVKATGQASISFVQRRLRVGYNRAARMIEQMEREGIVGPSDGSRPREVLVRE